MGVGVEVNKGRSWVGTRIPPRLVHCTSSRNTFKSNWSKCTREMKDFALQMLHLIDHIVCVLLIIKTLYSISRLINAGAIYVAQKIDSRVRRKKKSQAR